MKRSGLIAAAAATLIVFGLHQDVGAAPPASTSANTAETYKQLNLFGDVLEIVRNGYADEVKDDQLVEGAINGMLTRAIIKIQSVRSHLEGNNIGYIRVTSFNEQTDVGLNNAMKNLKQQANNKLIGVILDLRNNPGGLLDQAVAVSDAFLEKGEIVSTRGRRADDAQRYNARPGDIASGLPVAE